MTKSVQSPSQLTGYIKQLAVLLSAVFLTVACSTTASAPLGTTPTTEEKPPETQQVEKAPQPERPTPKYVMHKIQYAGETLSAIARWYTGDARNWKALAQANPTLNPKRMHIGDTIRIPEEMVTNRKPMPAVKTASKRTADPPQDQPKDDKTLFGPVETSSPSSGNEIFGPVDTTPLPAGDERLARPLETLD